MHIIILLSLVLSCICYGLATRMEERIDDLINASMACFNAPALTLAVVQGGQSVIAKSYGVMDRESNQPVSNNTLFNIASLTKAFAATTLVKVMEDKGYDLDAPLTSFDELKNLTFIREDLTAQVTARDILSHRTGLNDYNRIRLQNNFSLETIGEKLKYFNSSAPLRAEYFYNNQMYGLAGLITEQLTGLSWEEAVRATILSPLGMDTTTFISTAKLDGLSIASPHYYDDERPGGLRIGSLEFLKSWARNSPSGSILSNSVDMAKWLLFHLNSGKAHDQSQVVSVNALEETYRPNIACPSSLDKYLSTPIIPVTFNVSHYGFGWRIGSYRGYPMVTHTGLSWGFSSNLVLIPSKGLGIYYTFNTMPSSWLKKQALGMLILDLFLGERPWLNSSSVCSFPEPFADPPNSTKPTKGTPGTADRPLRSYTGKFKEPLYDEIEIIHKDEENFLRMFYGPFGRWKLYPVGGDEFYGEGIGPAFVLRLNGVLFKSLYAESGDIDAVTFESLEQRDPPTFVREAVRPTSIASPMNSVFPVLDVLILLFLLK
ncbi:uncharacterized protein LOC106179194 [Lingula anatina]|uniref:Uncharacterized protein LOC106179194 n=1 Tax=Lingula anatina TaxID=7574 RepID=A0A1S3K7E3_LINAN|nr:uncharacterized protein LOC106179194 [Lingula anatina]|eukprot:XP_013418181.1 uncharacterized protein LOC106179194 [Lingula anatina]